MTVEDLIDLVTRVVHEVAASERVPLPAHLDPDSPLFGERGVFDSLGLVALVLAVEEAIDDQHGVVVSLADERAMSQSRSPFRSIRSLAEYSSRLIEEAVAEPL